MNDTERQILHCLDELASLVEGMRHAPASPKPKLLPIFERIESLALQLGPSADPALRHFLRQKSYEKARHHLQELSRAGSGRPGS